MVFAAIRGKLKRAIQMEYGTSDYIMRVTKTPADNIYAYEELQPLVRCKDCKHFMADPAPIDPGWPWICGDTGRDMLDPDGFCAWGERKEV